MHGWRERGKQKTAEGRWRGGFQRNTVGTRSHTHPRLWIGSRETETCAFVCLFVHVCLQMKVAGHMGRSGDSPLDSALSFHCVGPGIELGRLGDTCLYFLSLCVGCFLSRKIFLGVGGSAHVCTSAELVEDDSCPALSLATSDPPDSLSP